MQNVIQPTTMQRWATRGLLGTIALLAVLMISQPVSAQFWVQDDLIWPQIYQMLPDLPRANHYVNRETRQVATNNTLVGRFIRYHIYTKGRSPFYRLDWKLTLGDYLGLNDRMDESAYPSRIQLRINPMDQDIEEIRKLNWAQRDALVNALVQVATQLAAQR